MNPFGLMGAIVAGIASAQGVFEVPSGGTLELHPAAAVGISSALTRFQATQQPLENFLIVLEVGDDAELITISFIPKLESGKRGLGGVNRLGRGVTYRVKRATGDIVGESLQR